MMGGPGSFMVIDMAYRRLKGDIRVRMQKLMGDDGKSTLDALNVNGRMPPTLFASRGAIKSILKQASIWRNIRRKSIWLHELLHCYHDV